MSGLEFRVLGPVEALRDGEPIALGQGVLVSVLAALLLSTDRVVVADTLAEFVWGEKAPEHPRAALHNAISRLRRLIGEGALETFAGGYRLCGDPERLDLTRFDHLLAVSLEAEAADAPASAVSALDEALALWREPLLGNVEAAGVSRAVAPLTERYLAATERWADLCLRLDRYASITRRLPQLVEAHPFRERMVGQLMVALFRTGRQADALVRYDHLRRCLAEELGVEPSSEVQGLYLGILRADSALAGRGHPRAGAEVVAPRQLPPGIADFTGRRNETARICAALSSGNEPPVVVLAGQGGVGKTALAVHCGLRLVSEFPDGHLYVDLRGAGGHPADSGVVLAGFLRALGVASQVIPDGGEERLALYRSLMAGRRMLVVLDNAVGEGQVRPLLPAGSGCAVIVTGRSRLTGLPGVLLIDLDVFDDAHAMDFLGRIVGGERLTAEPEHAHAIVLRCGGLPLALRIAGARLAARPHWRVAVLAERLADTRRRLDELSHGDLDLRATVALSYEGLTDTEKTLLRRLGLLDAPDFSAWVGAALLDIGLDEVGELFDVLADARLLEVAEAGAPDPPRYRFHDLVRVYAQERAAAEESPADRDAALARAFGGWLALAERAHREIHGGDYTILHGTGPRWRLAEPETERLITNRPMAWLEGERLAIREAIRQTAKLGMDELCWDLAWTTATLFEAQGYFDDWTLTQQWALSAVERAGNRRGVAAMLQAMTTPLVYRQRYEEARTVCERAARLFAEVGDWRGHALSLCRLAFLDTTRGLPDSALSRYEQAKDALHTADRYMEASALRGMAQIYLDRNDHDSALKCVAQAQEIFDDIGSGRGQAQALHVLGELRLRQRHFDQAEHTFRQFLDLTRALGETYGELYALLGLGAALAGRQRFDLASGPLEDALVMARRFGDHLLEGRALLELGELDVAAGLPDAATRRLTQSLTFFRQLATPLWQIRALETLAKARQTAGDVLAARQALAEADRLRTGATPPPPGRADIEPAS